MKLALKLISSLLSMLLTTQYCDAAVGDISRALNNYQYAMKVEWDQQDQHFRQVQEEILLNTIQQQLNTGATPVALLNESLGLIKDEKLKQDFSEALKLYSTGHWTPEDVRQHLEKQIEAMNATGASWSPLTKIVVGVVIGYAVLKVLMLVILYWDTDPNYGQTGDPPPKP